MSLIVTGTIGLDTIETPDGERREQILGGSGTYFAAAASLYGPVRLVAAVGDDFPEEHAATLARFRNIDTAGLEKRSGSATFRWGGKYRDNMDERDTVFTELGVLEEAPPPIPDAFKDSAAVFLANTHPAVQAGMLDQLPEQKLAVVDTMNLWIDIAKPELTALLGRVDGLVLNYEEAEQYTGVRNPVTAGRAILELGPRFVVIKKGEHGAILVHKDGLAALPAYPTDRVVDPTGAGDTFAGGFMAHLTSHAAGGAPDLSVENLVRAMAHGTVMASFTIETFSLDRIASLTKDELTQRYESFAAMVRV